MLANADFLYGLLGAFLYAAPKLVACQKDALKNGRLSLICCFEALLALASGAIMGGVYTGLVHQTAIEHALDKLIAYDERAWATTVGFLANAGAKPLTRVLLSVQRMLRGGSISIFGLTVKFGPGGEAA